MKIEFLIIKEENDNCNSIKTFKSFLKSNSEFNIAEKIITYKKFEVNFKLKTELINDPNKKERYFILTVDRPLLTKLIDKNSENTENINSEINNLKDLKRALINIISDSKYNFSITILWDDISNYLSRKSYPHINEIENLLRKLIYKFMLINIGKNWLSFTLPKELEKVNKKEKIGEKNGEIIREELFNFDFIDLIKFLFNKYNNSNLEETYTKIGKAKNIKDLDIKIIKDLIPKSNWERYFSKYIKIDKLNEKWEELYKLRNKVAHNKNINIGDYEKIIKLTNEIKEALNKATNKLDEINIKEEDKKEITKAEVFDNIVNKPLSLLSYELQKNSFVEYLTNHNLNENPAIKAMKDALSYNDNLFKSISEALSYNRPASEVFNSSIMNNLVDTIVQVFKELEDQKQIFLRNNYK
jgi:hypothetical protein